MRISAYNIELKFLNFKITISFPFLAVITLFLTIDKNCTIIHGLMAAFIHELGHILVMIVKKCTPIHIQFRAFDINIIDKTKIKRRYKDDIFVAVAGPLFNMGAAIILYFIYKIFKYNCLISAIYENILMSIFNILPIKSLDGGQILFNLLNKKLTLNIAVNILNITSLINLILLFILGLYIFFISEYNFFLLSLTCYLFVIFLAKYNTYYY